jgi:dihydrofolate reductase
MYCSKEREAKNDGAWQCVGAAVGVIEELRVDIKASVFVATSLDGFIARKDGNLDWLVNAGEQGSEDYGFQAFMDSVDVLVMGRHSYEKVVTFGAWPYGEKPVVVLSSRTVEVPAALQKTVSASSETPRELVERLSAQGASHLYVDGGITIQRFLDADLIDEITITRIPVLIGEGIPLFGRLAKDVSLVHRSTRVFDNGYVQSTYGVARS